MTNPMEDMILPCPLDICDGTGMVWNEDTREEEECPHLTDPYAVEPNDDEV